MLQIPASDTAQAVTEPSAGLGGLLAAYPLLDTGLWVAGIVLVAWVANTLTRRYILKIISRVVTQTKFKWDDAIFERNVFRRLANIAPAFVLYYGISMAPGISEDLVSLVQRVAMVFVVLVLVVTHRRNSLVHHVNLCASAQNMLPTGPVRRFS